MSQNLAVKITAQDLTGKAFKGLQNSFDDVAEGSRRAATEVAKLAGANGVGKFLALGGVGLGAAAVAAAAGLDRMAVSWSNNVIAMSNQAKLLGLPIGKLDALGGAATMVGASADALGSGLLNLQKGMYDAAGGRNGEMAAFLQTLGIHGSNASEALGPIADAVKRAVGPMDQLAIATEAFGAQGAELLPFLRLGARGINAYNEEAKKYGYYTDQSVEASLEFAKAQFEVTQSFRHLEDTFLIDVGPALSVGLHALADQVKEIAPHLEEWAKTGGPQRLKADVKAVYDGFLQLTGGIEGAWKKLGDFDAFLLAHPEYYNPDAAESAILGATEDKFGIAHARPKGGKLNADSDLDKLLNNAASSTGLDVNLLRSLVNAESGGKFGPSSDRSSSAYGYFQINDPTAKTLGINNHDYAQNVAGGSAYLKNMLGLAGGDRDAGVGAFHDGPNSDGLKWFKSHPGDISHFSSAAQSEMQQVDANYRAEQQSIGDTSGGSQITVLAKIEGAHHLPPGATMRLEAQSKGDGPKVARAGIAAH